MEQCKEMMMRNYELYRCQNKAWKDGYCKRHHPDAKAVREKASNERWKEKRRQSPEYRLSVALKRIVALENRIAELEEGGEAALRVRREVLEKRIAEALTDRLASDSLSEKGGE